MASSSVSVLVKEMGESTVIAGTPAVEATADEKVYYKTAVYTFTSSTLPPTLPNIKNVDWSYSWTKSGSTTYTFTMTLSANSNGTITSTVIGSYTASALYTITAVARYYYVIAGTAGTAGTADQVILDYNLGWNAGARSDRGLVGSGAFRFQVPVGAVGAVVGLATDDEGTAVNDAVLAAYVAAGSVKVLSKGKVVATGPEHYSGYLYALYDWRTSTLGIATSADWSDALYTMDGASYGVATMPLYLDSTLYSGLDSVVAAKILPGGGQSAGTLRYSGYGSEEVTGFQEDGVLPKLGASGRAGRGGISTLPAVRSMGSWSANFGESVLPTVAGRAGVNGVTPLYWAKQAEESVTLASSATLLSGQNYRQTGGALPSVFGYASDDARVGVQPSGVIGYSSFAHGLEGNKAFMVSTAVAIGAMSAAAAVTVSAINGSSAIAGTAEAGSTVTVTFPDGTTATVTVDDDGNWSVANPGLEDGDTVTVTAVGSDGWVASTAVTVDATAPDSAVVNAVSASGAIMGTAEAGSTVTVTFPDGTTATVTVDDDGNWSVANPGLEDGDEITVVVTDVAGNVSSAVVKTVGGAHVRMGLAVSAAWSMTVLASLDARIGSQLYAASGMEADDGKDDVWVLNTRTGATVRYTDYSFDSFAKIGNHYYGARRDGLYRLDGDTDAGRPISARVATGLQDFGIKTLKHVANVYLGAESGAPLALTAEVNGGERYTYHARRGDPYQRMQRVDLGRGLRSMFYGFEVASAGADFELDSIEFNVGATARRI